MLQINRLRIHHMKAPLGIDVKHPLVTWNVSRCKKQTAYRVKASGDRGTFFDSGICESSAMSCEVSVDFRGKERVRVEVCVYEGKECAAAETVFETGLAKEEWKAECINPEQETPSAEHPRPASYLKKTFRVERVKKARLYITCHGIYNVYLNGRHVDGFVMAPGVSEYDKLLQYQTYDVSDYLREGENTVIVSIGNGWWRGTATYDGIKNGFGADVALLAQLESDGEIICKTDETWMATQAGPILDSDNMAGEVYDARLETQIFDTRDIWHQVRVEEFCYENLCCSNCPPVREQEVFEPVLLITPKGERVLDFGQNLAGYIGFELEGKAGETYKFIHGETLDGDGNFCMSNFQSPNYWCAQEIVYTCKEGKNSYKPTNTFMGFRYVKVEGMEKIYPENFRAYAIYNDMEETAEFSCKNPLLNQLFHNAVWSLKGNLADIPTDCPTREKSGFTGDLANYVYTMLYLMDCYPMLDKFIRNQAASQYEDGCVKQIIADPRERGWFDGAAGWSDSFDILPMRLGERYDDYRLFERYYEDIKKWVDFMIRRAASATRPGNLQNPYHEYLEDNGIHWGEWAEPGMVFETYLKNILDNGEPEAGTAYLAYACQILSGQAERMGKTEDASYYREKAEGAKAAYRYAFAPDGKVESERMCRYIRPIALNLFDEEEKRQAAADLNRLVIEKGYTLNTGFLSTHELCRVLSDYGYEDTAWKLVLNENYPGWLYNVKNGATTIPENWCAYQPDGSRKDSFNHYSYGAIVGWLMDSAAGIHVKDGGICVEPKPCREVGGLKAAYRSPKGKIVSAWEYKDDGIHYHISIPGNCTAQVKLPSGQCEEVSAGDYYYIEKI